ncbi:hypothetical protein ACFCP7_22960, partial [Paenibacillus elgii]
MGSAVPYQVSNLYFTWFLRGGKELLKAVQRFRCLPPPALRRPRAAPALASAPLRRPRAAPGLASAPLRRPRAAPGLASAPLRRP